MRAPIPSRLTALQGGLLVVAALVGATLLPRFEPFVPDLVVPVVVAGALRGGRATGVLLGLCGGWLVDLMPPGTGTFGLTALTYAAAGFVVGSLQASRRHSPALPALAVVGAAALVHAVSLVADLLAARAIDLVSAGLSVLVTGVVGALLVPALVHHEQRLVQRGRA